MWQGVHGLLGLPPTSIIHATVVLEARVDGAGFPGLFSNLLLLFSWCCGGSVPGDVLAGCWFAN
jgi:hypothetical protein